jgi:hypothetical protein
LAQLRASRPAAPDAANTAPILCLNETIAYVEGQRPGLGNYAAWQEAGDPVGSGLIDRAVALVIKGRMKPPRHALEACQRLGSRRAAHAHPNADWDAADRQSPRAL